MQFSHLDAVLVLEEIAKVSVAIAFPIFESSFGPSIAISHLLQKACVPKYYLQFVW